MKKNNLILFIIWIFISGCAAANISADQVCFDKTCFLVQTASTSEQRQLGLMFRKQMDPDKGMLFIFEEARVYPFWMKNTKIPLDIIWLDDRRKIVHIEKNVQPCQHDPCPNYDPMTNAMYVLEVNAGLTDEKNIQVGHVARFNLNTDQIK